MDSTRFCSSRTSAAYHSPNCDWGWVVHDPNRVENMKIPHKPPYHTYSRWILGDQTYILAYRDIDQQPDDMAADIYLMSGSHPKLVGSVRHLGEIVTNVSTEKLTGASLPDVVFREDCGELKCVNVLRFSGDTARSVFNYAASTIDITSAPQPAIVATSNIANLVEKFAWDRQSEKFARIEKRSSR
jgi:hypothetical protein